MSRPHRREAGTGGSSAPSRTGPSAHPAGARSLWHHVAAVAPGGTTTLVVLTVVSFVFAVVEAVVLVLVVLVALSVTDGTDRIDLPAVGWEVSTGTGLVVAGAAALANLLGHMVTARLSARLSSRTSYLLRARVIDSFKDATWTRQAQDREGALQESATTLVAQSSQLMLNVTIFLVGVASLVGLFLAAALVDPVVTAIVVAFSTAIFLALRPLTRRTHGTAVRTVNRNREFSEHVAAWVSMAMDLRVFGVHDAKAAELDRANRRAEATIYQTRLANRTGSSLYKDIALVFLVVAIGVLHLLSDVDLAGASSVLLLVVRSLNYAQQVQSALQSMTEMSPGLGSLLDRVASLDAEREVWGEATIEAIETVTLSGVGYEYEPGRVGVADLDLELRAGEALGIIGPSGGGKSTLVQLLLRLRRPTHGTIAVNGLPYEEVAAPTWSRLVSLVPQEPHLIEGTVAENIAYLREGIGDDAIEAAAAAAHVLDDLRRLPDGLHTRLGPRGAGLSGGQKQRVAIARALVGRPQLLVLDEPSSALDPRSEALLQQTIAELTGRVLLVIVAHRLTTLESCDRVMVMEAGRCRSIGPRAQVLAEARRLDGWGVAPPAELGEGDR